MKQRIEIIIGDITRQQVDAIVNAANTALRGGGGVDGAIHRAAGPRLMEACRRVGHCPTGGARITDGYDLPCGKVIHTVGPVWRGGAHGEPELLASCYRASLEIASRYTLKTIAFPSISTGAYGFPLARASLIALGEMNAFLAGHDLPEKIVIVCFNRTVYDAYTGAHAQWHK